MIIHLYVKRHLKTGLKYFGKTSKDPHTYRGSGKYWLRHLKSHGPHVETLNVWTFDSLDKCQSFAIQFSKINSIVESKEWANLQIENGIDGMTPGTKLSEEHRNNIIKSLKIRKRKPHSEETKKKIALALQGRKFGPKHSDEWKSKRRLAMLGENNPNYKSNL